MLLSPAYLVFCPYLSLNSPLKLGAWTATPLSHFKGTWAPGLERMARQFLRAFHDAADRRISDPALIVHSTRGVDGVMPSRKQWRALQQALDFAVINSNPYRVSGDGSWSATTDNSE